MGGAWGGAAPEITSSFRLPHRPVRLEVQSACVVNTRYGRSDELQALRERLRRNVTGVSGALPRPPAAAAAAESTPREVAARYGHHAFRCVPHTKPFGLAGDAKARSCAAAAFLEAHPVAGDNDSRFGMTRAERRVSFSFGGVDGTCCATSVAAIFRVDVNHSVLRVLSAKVPVFGADHSEPRARVAARVLAHLLPVRRITIPSFACFRQNRRVLEPGTPKLDRVLHPSCSHAPEAKETMPSFA